MKDKRKCLKVAISVAFLAVVSLIVATAPPALSDNAGAQLTPKVDPTADVGHKTLQAGIQHNVQQSTSKPQTPKPLKAGASDSGNRSFVGKLRGGAKTAGVENLKGSSSAGQMNAAATSGFGIIGVKFVLSMGRPPVINRVFPGTPAQKVALQNGDTIVAVDGVPTYGLTKEEVYDLIIGSPGTDVNLSIQHNGEFHVVTCTRMDINDITDPLVRRDYMLNM